MSIFNVLSVIILSQLLLIIFAIRVMSFKKDSFIWLFLSFFVETFFGSALGQQVIFSQYIKEFAVELPELIIAITGVFLLFKNKENIIKLTNKTLAISFSIALVCVIYSQFIYAYAQNFYAGIPVTTLILIISIAIFSIANYMGYILLMQKYALGFLLNAIFFLQALIINGYYLIHYPNYSLAVKFITSSILAIIFLTGYIKNKKYTI